ncbi:MAG: FkbM family methyltransferase [Deltaproteobacteria bacterium]|nr:FkbM family methyltransferase [Deltaproteobacteria bacterium]
MMMLNSIKKMAAKILFTPVDTSTRLREKLLGQKIQTRNHYYLMKMFRLLSKQYLIDFDYPNPLDPALRLKLKLDLCQNTQQWLFRSGGSYEMAWIKKIGQGLKTADAFVDIGAHVGVFALTLAQAHPSKRVIAVEANTQNYDRLVDNIGANGLQNVKAVQGAVALQKGKARFYFNPINDGGGSLLPFEKYKTGGISLDAKTYQTQNANFIPSDEVFTYRLDDLITEKSVVKIDVEGSEMEVLTSGEGSFSRGWVQMVVIEVGNEITPEVLAWFDKKDFDCFTLENPKPIQQDGDWGSKIGYGGRMLIASPRR